MIICHQVFLVSVSSVRVKAKHSYKQGCNIYFFSGDVTC